MTSVTWVPTACSCVHSSFECTNDASNIARANTASYTPKCHKHCLQCIHNSNEWKRHVERKAYVLDVSQHVNDSIEGFIEDSVNV